jgi:hypothetical protein
MSAERYLRWCDGDGTVSLGDMQAFALSSANKNSVFQKGKKIVCRNRMKTYEYQLAERPIGRSQTLKVEYRLKSGQIRYFEPKLHPASMLALGVFEGKMINDCMQEFPIEWFADAIKNKTLRPGKADANVNFYKIKSRQSLKTWKRNGWIYGPDERGWFQWYCRYILGRRIPDVDLIQMKRWAKIARWHGVLKRHPERTIIRQTLLQWAWIDPREDPNPKLK